MDEPLAIFIQMQDKVLGISDGPKMCDQLCFNSSAEAVISYLVLSYTIGLYDLDCEISGP